MSLIERLGSEEWPTVVRSVFELTLDILQHDPFRSVGSSVDDMGAWLTSGGVPTPSCA